MEWINDGVHPKRGSLLDTPTVPFVGVIWTLRDRGDEGEPMVTSAYAVEKVGNRYRVASTTTYTVGMDEDQWSHTELGAGSAESYETRKMALAWARRMAEFEAANPAAIAWDGEPA